MQVSFHQYIERLKSGQHVRKTKALSFDASKSFNGSGSCPWPRHATYPFKTNPISIMHLYINLRPHSQVPPATYFGK